MPAVNGTEIRLTGLSRSGNHPLVHWIVSQVHGSYCFLNCCEGKSNPYETARPMDDGHRCWSNIAGLDLEREQSGHFTPKDWFLFSHEDNFLGNACSAVFEREHDQWVGRSERRVDMLLLRDPYNLFASRLAHDSASVTGATAARIWKQHARQFLHRPRALRQEPILVRYDRWVLDQDYRREIAGRLGFELTDRGIDAVPNCGGGSTFDGRAYDGAARNMRLFDRWRSTIDEPEYRELFDPELLEMAVAIFGPHPAADLLSSPLPSLARDSAATVSRTRPTSRTQNVRGC